jgi:hypothetical protein
LSAELRNCPPDEMKSCPLLGRGGIDVDWGFSGSCIVADDAGRGDASG